MNEYAELLALLNEQGARISFHRELWMTYRDGIWTVYSRPYGKQKTRTLYEGSSLSMAIIVAKGSE